MTKNEAIKIISRIETTWSVVFDNMKKEIYGENLADLDYQKTVIAIKKLAQTEKFTPTIAHIREACVGLVEPQIDVLEAWQRLNGIISFRRYNHKEAMECAEQQDSLILQFVKSVGFINLCNSNPEFLRTEFEKLFREAAKSSTQDKILSNKLKLSIGALRTSL